MDFHELASIFPLMEGPEYEMFVEDIREHGLREPIWTWQGKVIDGRNRYRACLRLGIEPDFREWDGNGNLVAFIVSLNLHRRHLNESQRAMIAARLARLPQGARTDIRPIGLMSQPEAAELLNVSDRSLKRAKQVIEDGAPELQEAVSQGEIAVSTAAEITELPKPEQAELVAKGEEEILEAARRIRARKTEERRTAKREHLRTMVFPENCYRVIYADPPWEYSNSGFEQSAADHYPTMPLDAILALPVHDCCTSASVLFLWATSPLLPEAFEVIKAWGFTYKASMVWDKGQAPGIGWFVRTEHELLLIATKEENAHPTYRPASVMHISPTRHSEKPEEIYNLIEQMYPGPYVELFARGKREGWDAWGNELDDIA